MLSLLERTCRAQLKIRLQRQRQLLKKARYVAIFSPVTHCSSLCPQNKMTCTRCLTMMYPGASGSPLNHRRGYCSDGAPVRMKCGGHIPYPQPPGIFTKAEQFHHLPFLLAVRELHRRVADECTTTDNLDLDYFAFSKLLGTRLVKVGEDYLFRLWTSLKIDEQAASGLIVEHQGCRYLRIDCLRSSQTPTTSAKWRCLRALPTLPIFSSRRSSGRIS